MASIFKRRLKDGKDFKWRAVVRIKGYPTVCETFDRKQEAEDWGKELERKIKAGQYNFTQLKQQSTLTDLVERFLSDGGLEHHRSKDDTLRHFDYWKGRMGGVCLGPYYCGADWKRTKASNGNTHLEGDIEKSCHDKQVYGFAFISVDLRRQTAQVD